ncbi:hypothetical protein [Burkholderia gladioli]|uniref:hypothetical protein n=1 Tax=Burkholderia gladioli TaxID=28095 RepID=UPI00163EFB07|nr:hypothetical protein [Burkholderia gladioli]
MTSLNTWRAHRVLSLVGMTALTLALTACGGGGGGGSTSGSNGTGGTPSSGTTSSNGAALLAAYTPPADIAADLVPSSSAPAFDVGNSNMASNCQVTSKLSPNVIVTPDAIVYGAGASTKAMELAADLFENQALPQVRTALGLPTTGVAFGGGKVQICVDTALGVSDSETGTSLTGQTVLGGSGPVIQMVSADSSNFDSRYPGATSYTSPVGTSYATLFVHEGTHAALFSLSEPFGALPTFVQEGLAQLVAQQPAGTKSSVLAAVKSTDILAVSNVNSDMNLYPTYLATMDYLTSSAPGGLGFGLTNVKTLLATYVTDATTACAAAIPSGTIPPASQLQGMPAGEYNTCVVGAGAIDARLNTAFDLAFSQSFKNADGSPLYLHTGEDPGGNALEQTLVARLSAFLQ